MTSDERKAARRIRRDAKKQRNKEKRCAGLTIDKAANYSNLYEAATNSAKGVRWKASTQRYLKNLFLQLVYAREDLLDGKDIRKKVLRSRIMERGKRRDISAPGFAERVIQKTITQNILVPALTPTLAPGCTANVKGKGTDYALMRLKEQLVSFYREHKGEGYVLLIDFSNYFGNIDHDVAKQFIDRYILDSILNKILHLQIDREDEGLGLGSELNQLLAVAIPSALDYLGERWEGIVYSGRYMDDSYFIASNKEVLKDFLKEAEEICSSLGITINPKKSQIVKLSNGFTFLKKRFFYSETGKVIVTPCRESIVRIRRKMKKLSKMVAAGEMTLEQAKRSYLSARGSLVRRKGDGIPRFRMNTYETVKALDKQFYNLFGEHPVERKEKHDRDRTRERS